MDIDRVQRKIHMFTMLLVLIGALNWGLFGAFNIDLVEKLFKVGLISKVIYITFGIAAVSLMFHRDTYLPFLGESVMPCSVLSDRFPTGASHDVVINVDPNVKVLYWATEPATIGLEKIQSWKEAYTYENAGVATADESGKAILKVREPQAYTVSLKGVLNPHVHYRVCGKNGWIGRIDTVFL